MTKKKKIGLMVLSVILIILSMTMYYFMSIYKELEGLNKSQGNTSTLMINASSAESIKAPEWTGTSPINILLMGVDARKSGSRDVSRSDSMMVVSLDPNDKHIHVFSILRDTYVNIPDHGQGRINTAIGYGTDTAMQTVSELLGIPIHFYVKTDFRGFIKLVDEIGGVDFYVEKDMNYESKADNHEYDIHLSKGQQHFDGKTALQYVRFRHDAMSDFARTERQRQFIAGAGAKLITTTSILKFPSILEEVSPYIDTNLSVNNMWKLATLGYKSSLEGSEQIPPMKLVKEMYVGRSAVLGVLDDTKLKQFVQDTIHNKSPDTDAELTESESLQSATSDEQLSK